MFALDIITDAYERCNRLSPGEVLNADDAAFGLRRLNAFVDELGAQDQFLFRDVLTSAVQTGNITLGAGSWLAIAPGDVIVSATANNIAMSQITMQQYNELYQPSTTGFPSFFAPDGLSTVYLWPTPTAHTIKLQTRVGAANFADLNVTNYTMPTGYKAMLGSGLAVRIAPNIMGQIPPSLMIAERKCAEAVRKPAPAILGVDSYTGSRGYYPPRLF